MLITPVRCFRKRSRDVHKPGNIVSLLHLMLSVYVAAVKYCPLLHSVVVIFG